MFQRATRRLTLVYAVIFALVLLLFSAVFWAALAVILQPTFDLVPDITPEAAAQATYHATLDRAAIALFGADLAAVGAVSVAAWYLARRALRPIEDATQRQARFVADASHELRTPVALIRTVAEAALIESTPEPERTAALAAIVVSADRLSRVANDLLMLARTERRTDPRLLEPVDLSVIVAETIDEERAAFGQLLRRRSRNWRTNDAPTPGGDSRDAISLALTPDLRVRADPLEVQRIISNLIENAVIHGGGKASVRTIGDDGEAIVEVADRGPGIEPRDLPRLFEPFYRGRADARAPDGSGLGLAIAQTLAKRNGGRITLESRPGAGATFRFRLPIVRSHRDS